MPFEAEVIDLHVPYHYKGNVLIHSAGAGFEVGDGWHCRGCLWWLRHFLGAFLAEKVAEGPLRLAGPEDPGRISTADELQTEIRYQQRRPDADYVTVAAQHGSIWHTIAMEHQGNMPALNRYPLARVEALCGEHLYDEDHANQVEQLNTDIAYECRHAVGHAVFYTVALREQNMYPRSCLQFRPGSYTMHAENWDVAGSICWTAPEQELWWRCKQGTEHSYNLLRTPDAPEHTSSDDDYQWSPPDDR